MAEDLQTPSPQDGHCTGCGRPAEACGGACGRADGPPRFCRRCGRRLQEIAVSPGMLALHCVRHGLHTSLTA